jgi:putative aldouronate transport system substrate-binding protein
VAYGRSLVQAGVVTPDFPTTGRQQALSGYMGNHFAFYMGLSLIGYSVTGDAGARANPPFLGGPLVPFGADGGKGSHFLGPGYFSINLIKKGTPERVKELLGIVNALAAPFGSRERLLISSGVEATDFTWDAKGFPALTPLGRSETGAPFGLWIGAPTVLVNPSDAVSGFIQAWHDGLQQMFAIGVTDPTVGLFSNTYAQNGTVIARSVQDGVVDILFGRSEFASFDGLVANWRSAGGDQIRTEYQQAFAQHRQ